MTDGKDERYVTSVRLTRKNVQKLNILKTEYYGKRSQNDSINKSISDALYFRELISKESIYIKKGDELVRLELID